MNGLSPDALLEIMHAIDDSRGWELDLGARTPFYAFICVDLVVGMDDTRVSDTREFHATIRPRKNSNMGAGVLNKMTFPYTIAGFADMLAWIEEQKLRPVCENSTHRWCKLSLPDWHLCSACALKLACLGGRSPTTQGSFCTPASSDMDEMKPLV